MRVTWEAANGFKPAVLPIRLLEGSVRDCSPAIWSPFAEAQQAMSGTRYFSTAALGLPLKTKRSRSNETWRAVQSIFAETACLPDLVVMDIRLRGSLNGIEAARQIQSARAIPVIYLTAQSGEQLREKGPEVLGPRVSKTFDQKTLQTAIQHVLRASQSSLTRL